MTPDAAYGVALKFNGNLIVAGNSAGQGYVRELSATNGAQQWNTGSLPAALSVTIDSEDDIYVVGFKNVVNQGQNAWIGKFTTDGVAAWDDDFNGSANGGDQARDVAVDFDGNIVIVGYVNGFSSAFVRKYDPEGNVVWTREYIGNPMASDSFESVAIDPDNNIIVAGSQQITDAGADIWVVKLTP